ncbi:hypothetical protein Tco_0194374 [Tanacetum coccineum]
MNQNYYDPNLCYNSNSSGFDQYQPRQYSVTHRPPQEKSMAELLLEEKLPQDLQALCEKLNKYVQEKQEENNIAEEQAAKVSSQFWKPPIFYDDDDDDDEESSIPSRDIISELPLSIAVAPDLPITDSLIMEDEHLDTILETELDEENESSVKDLNLTPSEYEDLFDNESECDVPVCDDSSPKFTTFSNPLFDSNDDFTSNPHHFNAESDLIESLLNRDTSIVSSPKFDSLLEEFSGELAHIDLIFPEIDEADFDPEEEIRLVEKLLYDNSSPRPPKELNSDNSDAVIESFSPSPIPIESSDSLMEEIDIFLASDDSIPPGIENDDYDSERDILEELLNNDSLSLPENESFHFDRYYDPSSPLPPAKPPDDDGIYFDAEPDTGILTIKVVDDISERYVIKPRILPTQPTLSLCLVIDTLLPFSSKNEDNVFNPGILASKEEKSPHLLSHRGFKAFQLIYDFSESPMMIYGEDITILNVPIAPDYDQHYRPINEDSRALVFVPSIIEDQKNSGLKLSNSATVFEMFIPNNTTVPKLKTAEDLQGDALLHYDAEMELMNLILLSIPNDIYNSQFEKLVNVSRANELEKSHDPLALVAHTGSSSRKTSSYYVTHPTSVVDIEMHTAQNQAIIQGDRVNIQSRNSGNAGRNNRRAYETLQLFNATTAVEKGHYAKEWSKARFGLEYFMEQMLLAKQDEAGVILTDEQNDFLFADASRMEEIEELSANICLMARIQPTDNTSDAG